MAAAKVWQFALPTARSTLTLWRLRARNVLELDAAARECVCTCVFIGFERTRLRFRNALLRRERKGCTGGFRFNVTLRLVASDADFGCRFVVCFARGVTRAANWAEQRWRCDVCFWAVFRRRGAFLGVPITEWKFSLLGSASFCLLPECCYVTIFTAELSAKNDS